jgi:tetratricopeptide (TPR) repeat protein
VISLGVVGHRLADDLIKLMVHGQSLKPDLVLFQITPDDLDFYKYDLIFQFQKLPDPFMVYSAKESEVLSETSLDWKVFYESLQQIQKWSTERSVPVGFLVFPAIDSRRTGNNFNHYDLKAFSSFPQIASFGKVVDEIQTHGIPALYLLDTFRDQAGDRYLSVSQTMGQLNAYGHRLVAQTLLSFLLEQKLISCEETQTQKADPLWNEENLLRTEAAQKWFQFNGSYSAQIDFYEKLNKMYPEDPWVLSLLASSYFFTERWRDSARMYELLTEVAPSFASPWYHLALNTNSQMRKVHLLENMLRVVPDHTQAMVALVPLYLEAKRTLEACSLLRRITEIPITQEQFDQSKMLLEQNRCDRLSANTSEKT